MPDDVYQARSRLFQRTQTFTLSDDALVCRDERVPLGTITSLRLYAYPGVTVSGTGSLPSVCWCKVTRRGHASIRFRNQHIVRPFVFEDRMATFRPFVKALGLRLAASHPDVPLLLGLPPIV